MLEMDTTESSADRRLVVIAGPCVLEDVGLGLEIAEEMTRLAREKNFRYVFKSSFDKANRTQLTSYRGPGLEQGLADLETIKQAMSVPVLTDVHEAAQASRVAEVADVLQIPAFLCRQTDLICACGATGRVVNIKKGQFMAPADMAFAIEKARSAGARSVWATERGTFFGYGDLVVDMRSLRRMRGLDVPVVFDATHSIQQPGSGVGVTLGRPDDVPALVRAAVAVGIDALFIETHPDPRRAKSDAASQLPLRELPALLDQALRLHQLTQRLC